MSQQLTFDACLLCGITSADVHVRLVEWLEPVAGKRWSNVPRCDDRVACRARVEAHEPWPVADRTPAPEKPAAPAEEPVAAPKAPAPVVEKELPWLS